jgi:cobalt-zinc-cadmium efflux system membrane fusion protein
MASCSSNEDANDQSMDEKTAVGSDLITVSEQQFNSSEFELGQIEKREFQHILTVNGSTHLPEKNKSDVSSFVGGSVGSIDLIHGQWVKRGQVLFSVSNPELINWQQEYLVLESELEFQQSEFERQELLDAENITAKKNLKQALSILNVTKSKLAGLSKKLSMIGIEPKDVSNENLTSALQIYAPTSGYLTAINVKRGMFLEPFETAMEISNTNHIHMELKVLEKDLFKIKNGQKVKYSLQNDASKEYEATVYLIEKMVDENRMINVHCHLGEEEEKTLIPGMFVSANIELEQMEAYSLPEDAVIDFDSRMYVLQHEANSKYDFKQQEVKVGRKQNGYYQLDDVGEIDLNAKYLTKGAYYLILGESNGHSH